MNSKPGKNLEENKLGNPKASNLANYNFAPMQYHLLGDDIFPLKSWLILLFAVSNSDKMQKVYIYHPSQSLRVIKKTFGIFFAWWRIMTTLTALKVSLFRVILIRIFPHTD